MPSESIPLGSISSETFEVVDGDLTLAQLEGYLSSPAIAVDTEAMGLLPHRDRLCLIQLCDGAGRVTLIRIPPEHRHSPHLKTLMEAPTVDKVFHFARFDLAMLQHHLGIRTWPVFCTKIASKLARTYTPRHGLKDLVQEMCGVELDKKAQTSDWGAVLTLSTQQLAYAANDVRYLLSAKEGLQTMLEREGRWELAVRCFNHLPTLIDLDLLGYEKVFEHS